MSMETRMGVIEVLSDIIFDLIIVSLLLLNYLVGLVGREYEILNQQYQHGIYKTTGFLVAVLLWIG